MKFTIAIDGPAAAGKGTIARRLATDFGFIHLDTGLLYRAVGIKSLEIGNGIIDEIIASRIASNLKTEDFQRTDLRTARVASAASKVAAMPEVRAALLEFQRNFSRRDGGAILDGRDIGTVVCPDADVKFFVTASDDVRVERRYAELREKDPTVTFEKVRTDLFMRDTRDSTRDSAPMKQAEDAILLDTTKLSIESAVEQATAIIKERLNGK